MKPTETLLGGPLDGLVICKTTLPVVYISSPGDEATGIVHVYRRLKTNSRLQYFRTSNTNLPLARQGYFT